MTRLINYDDDEEDDYRTCGNNSDQDDNYDNDCYTLAAWWTVHATIDS